MKCASPNTVVVAGLAPPFCRQGDVMILKKRKNIRLTEFDYSTAGAYFVTVCVFEGKILLGSVSTDSDTANIQQTDIGRIVSQSWEELPDRFPNITLDEFIVMPDHIHGILTINSCIAANASNAKLGDIIGAFKSLSTLSVNRLLQRSGSLWQRSYYDRVIRNEKELHEIRKYIRENPLRLSLRQD